MKRPHIFEKLKNTGANVKIERCQQLPFLAKFDHPAVKYESAFTGKWYIKDVWSENSFVIDLESDDFAAEICLPMEVSKKIEDLFQEKLCSKKSKKIDFCD